MIAAPRTLPVGNLRAFPGGALSWNSLRLFRQCPEKWYRRNILGEPEPTSGPAVVGGAVGAAETLNYAQKIDTGEDLPAADVLDAYAGEFDLRADSEPVEWGDEKQGKLKDSGARVLPVYHRLVAPRVDPVAVERQFVLELADVDWVFTGYIDVEEADDGVVDLKVKGKALSQQDADQDGQPTSYLLAKRAEHAPAPEFRFHPLVRVQRPEVRHVQPVITTRTDEQLDAFVTRLYDTAAEIQWRLENDVWAGAAPGVWWCSDRYCGFWRTCPYGGKFSAPVATLPQAGRQPMKAAA